MVIARVWTQFSAISPKFSLLFAGSFKVGFLKYTNGASQGFCPIVCYLSQTFAVLLVVIWLACRMLGMLIPNASVLLSAICPKVLLVFGTSLKIGHQNATNGNTQGLGPIVCQLSQSFAVFLLVVVTLPSRMLQMVIARVWALLSASCLKVSLFFAGVLSLASRMVEMVIPQLWSLLSAVCPKVSLFFASSFKVGF